jgi:hypothetical protein
MEDFEMKFTWVPGGSGDNRTRLRGQMLQTLRNDEVLELLLVLAQHCNQVRHMAPVAAKLLESNQTDHLVPILVALYQYDYCYTASVTTAGTVTSSSRISTTTTTSATTPFTFTSSTTASEMEMMIS